MKTARLAGLILVAIGLIVAPSASGAAPDDARGSIVVGGVTRTYAYHVPTSVSQHPALVLMFHGHYMTGEGQSKLTHFDVQSDKDGFIVVYPDGINRGWNDGRTLDKGHDDIGFAGALIDRFAQRYHVDLKRVYATGFSNGGTFTQYLGCNLSGRIAAIAPVSGSLPSDIAPSCHPKRPMPILEIAGSKDPLVPYGGGQIHLLGVTRGSVISAQQTIAFWAKNARCAATKVNRWVAPPVVPSDGTSVAVQAYSGCANGAEVQLYTVNGGGHTWPDGPQYLPAFVVGKASNQLNASETIARFLLTKRLP